MDRRLELFVIDSSGTLLYRDRNVITRLSCTTPTIRSFDIMLLFLEKNISEKQRAIDAAVVIADAVIYVIQITRERLCAIRTVSMAKVFRKQRRHAFGIGAFVIRQTRIVAACDPSCRKFLAVREFVWAKMSLSGRKGFCGQ